ncbi:MAG TPA: AMP-binding protein [Actinomycetota bacterium]|nr:AMP-binding protein [Actinomycetota bacterium]
MAPALDGIRQLVDTLHPRTIKRLREAGAMDVRSPLAFAMALPWLVGRGPSLGIVSQMNATVVGAKTAIHDRNGSITWRELDANANRVAHALQEDGIAGKDAIAMVLRNGREMVEIALGAQKVGVVCCPLNTWAKPKELKVTLEQADPSVLVYDTAHSEQIEKADVSGITLYHVGNPEDALPDSKPYEEWIEGRGDGPPGPFTMDRGSAKVVIHTSGTTGKPKGAARDSSAAGLGALANLISVVPYRRDDVIFCPAPMFHSFGLATMTFGIALGATMVLPQKFDAEESLKWIEEYEATAASFVPVMIKRILALDDDVKKKYDLSSLRIVMASGSAMSPDLRNAAMELFGEVLYDLYGSTEVGWVTIATPDDMRKHAKTVGKPVPGTEIAVFSSDGERLPANESGELFIKSNILFEGYTSGETKDERDGYMSIGDLGRLDDDGYLFVEGRADDMVVIGGENVYPIEVEELIEGISGVEEAAVLGVTDDEYGEVLAAFVVGSVSEDDVVSACKDELASYKVPRRVKILDELPRTSTGKILKRKLIEEEDHLDPLDD